MAIRGFIDRRWIFSAPSCFVVAVLLVASLSLSAMAKMCGMKMNVAGGNYIVALAAPF